MKWSFLLLGVATLSSTISLCKSAEAAQDPILWEQINRYAQETPLPQPETEVQQLRDVYPGDWAYEALENLVKRYNCIVGYPDRTFRGDRPLSRWEFAAGLNACTNTIERLIQEQFPVLRQDLEQLGKLNQAFEAELAVLGRRVDDLENRTAFLEDHQFSTTTKLKGKVTFSLGGAFGEEKAGSDGQALDTQVTLDDRVQLNFDTSFSGKDLLKVRLDAVSAQPLGVPVTGTNMTRLAFDGDTDNDLTIGQLFYRFPVNKRIKITVDGTGGRLFSNVPNYNPLFSDALSGSISRFGRFNPIYYQGILGAGATVSYKFSDRTSLSLAYLARNPEDPTEGNGLFNGSYAALAQLDFNPTDTLNLGLTYVRAYYPSGKAFVSAGTGSIQANTPFALLPTSADQIGFQTNWRIHPKFSISGWLGWTMAHAEASGIGFQGATVNKGDDAEMLNWAVTFSFPDLGSPGSVGGLLIGNPPKVLDNDAGDSEPSTAWHIQAQYSYRINNHIAINPGMFVIINPENDSDNKPIWVGTLRTIFEF